MANIKLNQLNSVTHELTQNESNTIVGGNFWKKLEGLVGIGTGIITIKQGIDILQSSSVNASNSTDVWTNLALQEAFGPDPFWG